MSTQENTPRWRSRTVIGIVAAVVVVVVVLLVLALTGAARGLFARQVDRVVRTDVDASALIATLVTYPDTFRGSYLAPGRVELGVDIEQSALRGGDPAARPATIVLRVYSCPGTDSPAAARLVIDGADAEHVRPRPAEAGGGFSLVGAYEIVAVQPVAPGAASECRIDLAAR